MNIFSDHITFKTIPSHHNEKETFFVCAISIRKKYFKKIRPTKDSTDASGIPLILKRLVKISSFTVSYEDFLETINCLSMIGAVEPIRF